MTGLEVTVLNFPLSFAVKTCVSKLRQINDCLQPAESAHHPAPLPEWQPQIYEAAQAYPEVHDSGLPEVYHPQVVPGASVYEVGDGLREKSATGPATEPSTSGICGLSRKTVLVSLAALLLVAAAIAGGTAGGIINARNMSGEQNTPSGTDTLATPSSSSTGAGATPVTSDAPAKAPSPLRFIATTQDEVSIFNFWQAMTGDIWMHAYYNHPSSWADPFRLNLTYPAIPNTPLGVLTWKFADYFEIRVHYAAAGQSGVAGLVYRCYENGTVCTNPTNGINKAVPAPPAGVGYALVTPALNNLRSYSVGRDGSIQEAAYTPTLDQWTLPVAISNGAKAHVASPLAATMVQDDIWLFWFSDHKRLQFATSTYTGSTWSAGMFIFIHLLDPAWPSLTFLTRIPIVGNISAAVPTELPRSLGVTRSDTPDATQVFFLDGLVMQQSQYSNNKWSSGTLGPSMPNSSISNGPLGAVGWNSTAVRLYYVVNGKIREVASEAVYGQWRVGTMTPDQY
ncbi:hypothetical protein B0T14DRAFT_554367 [Immersiella caudata]|uniref:Fucose-specific lectin n=1 Tax=Immersiella caudata TaxID=314043 RepID=A0AA39WP09_9PEZI|nr:hypothetical protein B0T14DRAFT_554367 [Immersiella caudata]